MTDAVTPGRRPHVLLVEDEAANRALVRAVLARSTEAAIRDLELSEAPSLRAAREVLAGRPVDLVLLDVRLPDGSGLDLAREMAARGEGPRPRVIVMSASVLPADREAALASGADAFLGKPFRVTELLALLAGQAGVPPHQGERPPHPSG